MKAYIFACVHNAGRSQMASAFFNAIADPACARAISAGTAPADRVHPEVLEAMAACDLELSSARPQLLTADLARDAEALITMGCGELCPNIPGLRAEDWALPDPKGRSQETVAAIRDDIRQRVAAFVDREGVG